MEWLAEVKRDTSFTFVQLCANGEALVGATAFAPSVDPIDFQIVAAPSAVL